MATGHLADREWRLVREEARSGAMNMALDEVAAETAAAGGPRTLRVYRWTPSTLSLGYRQDPDTVDWAHCERAGVDVVRRQTGGGGIYHDGHGDLSYAVVAPKAEVPGDLTESYRRLCAPVLDAFDRLGVPARFAESARPALYEPACYLRELHPAHDVVVGGDGCEPGPTADAGGGTGSGTDPTADAGGGTGAPERKVSGNAQHRRTDAVVQHGSLTYALRPERHLAVFADPGVDAAAFRERVTAIDEHADATRETAVTALEDALAAWVDADEGAWTDAELGRARELVAEKYGTEAWTRRRRP